jgi:hypothetical protein
MRVAPLAFVALSSPTNCTESPHSLQLAAQTIIARTNVFSLGHETRAV